MKDKFDEGMEALNKMLKEELSEGITTKVIAHHATQISIPHNVVNQFADLKDLHIKIKRLITEAMGTKKLHSLNYGIVEDTPTYVFVVGDGAWK